MDKKKLFLIMAGILILGTLLRLININKQEGMWNDEYLTWEIARAHFPKEFFEGIMRNCHAPLHYLYLKVWMYFFGEDDTSLRLSSLVPGVLSIITMYFAGRNLDKKKSYAAGIASAFFCAISGFLIYFSQEVRIYSLLFLLSSINVLSAIHTLDNPCKKNCILFTLTSVLICLEHTIGFVFVFFSVIGAILFAEKRGKFKKYLASAFTIALILLIPLSIFIYKTLFHQQYFSQWWAPFSPAKLAYFFTDLFSPYLVDITNAPPEFLGYIFAKGDIKFGFILFALIPLFIALCSIIRGVFVFDKKIKYFILTSTGVYLTVFAASLFGKIIFLTKYLTEIYPALILLAITGFCAFKNRTFKIAAGTVYAVLCLFFILVSNYSPVRLVRTEGQNIPPVMLKVLNAKETDKIVFLYYPKERFEKYSKNISKNKNISHISKYDFDILTGYKEPISKTHKDKGKSYRAIFLSKENKFLDLFLAQNVYSTIKKGDRFFLVDFSPVSFFNPKEIERRADDIKKYQETPFLYLVFSYVKNYVIDKSAQVLSYSGNTDVYSWRIYIFEKT